MAGRSAVAETMDGAGAGQRGGGRAEGAGSRHGRPRPGRRDGRAHRALRRGAGALRGAGRLRARGPGARGPGRPRLQPGDDGRRRRRAVRRLEDARGAGAHPADAARRDAARRAEQPPRPREPDLAGELPQGLRGRAADDLARPRVHEPHRHQDHRDRRRRADHLLRQLRILRAAARACTRSSSRRSSSASRRCSPRRSTSSSASRRAPRTPRRCRAG